MVQVSVLVVGAGPTGLGAATRLNQHGIKDWLLIDQVCVTTSWITVCCSITATRVVDDLLASLRSVQNAAWQNTTPVLIQSNKLRSTLTRTLCATCSHMLTSLRGYYRREQLADLPVASFCHPHDALHNTSITVCLQFSEGYHLSDNNVPSLHRLRRLVVWLAQMRPKKAFCLTWEDTSFSRTTSTLMSSLMQPLDLVTSPGMCWSVSPTCG